MNWNYIIHIGIISIALLSASLLRANIRFLQKYLIPAPIIAGIFLLLFYNFIAPLWGLKSDYLGELVYHLLNLSFIAMMLRVTGKKVDKGKKYRRVVAQNVTAVIAQYGLQTFFGLLVAALLMYTVMPDLFPAIGFTLALGFELGPGQAFSIGSTWEQMGFSGGSSVGLTLAAIGFLLGSFGGVVLINQGIRKGWIGKDYKRNYEQEKKKTGFFSRTQEERPVGMRLSTDGESIDSFTYHMALVMVTYLVSWSLLTGLTALLSLAGHLGDELASSLWGINFVFSAFSALGVKMVMRLLKVETTIDNSTCNRISGFSVDLTVAASLGAISIVAVRGYWLPIVLLTAVGAVITLLILPMYASRLYDDHQFYRMLLIYGTATGTLPTGLALLRVVDPDFETPAATDYLYSVGIVFFLAIPIILAVNLPAFSYTRGEPHLFWIAVGISAAYLIGSFVAYLILSGKKAFIARSQYFHMEAE